MDLELVIHLCQGDAVGAGPRGTERSTDGPQRGHAAVRGQDEPAAGRRECGRLGHSSPVTGRTEAEGRADGPAFGQHPVPAEEGVTCVHPSEFQSETIYRETGGVSCQRIHVLGLRTLL